MSKFKHLFFVIFLTSLISCNKNTDHTQTISVILPMEHKALQEIVSGFTDKLHAIYPKPIKINVLNAEGDVNVQRALIQQAHDSNDTVIVPVATGVSQMTAAMIHDKPIVSIAADLSENDRKKMHPCHFTVVQDDIPPEKILAVVHAAFPKLTQLTLLHSASDKIFPDVKAAIEAGKKVGIEIKPLMIATLPDLVSASQALPNSTQGIFILKDNLIASGIATLIKTANEKKIPLITSDNGTVESGAGLAVGVHEREIGEEGAILAAKILSGKSAGELPIVKMEKLTVFVNKKALEDEGQSFSNINNAARKLNYKVEKMS
jgi:putative ABC transport system substrate-binding protein